MSIVENWFVKSYPNEIFELTFNTTERWVSYHAYNRTTYEFGVDDQSEMKEIPDFLPEIDGIYLQTSMQNKDQISFYFIPVYRSNVKDRSIKVVLQGQ